MIVYRATLDVPRELVWFVAKLLLAERRRHSPRGACGGEDGAPGRTLVNGEEQPPKLTCQLHAGDVVRVETPGGGGHGAAE